jgi:phosphate-selective porin OprO/OprP
MGIGIDKRDKKVLRCLTLVAAIVAAMSAAAYAGEGSEDPNVRIRELELQMKQMAEQLKAMQEQLARTPQPLPAAAPTPGAKNYVEASFKNGLVFKDATGDWSLRFYARAQLDSRNFFPDDFSADIFSMRRARIGAIATFYDDFVLRIEGEYSGDGTSTGTYTKMNDGYLEYNHFKPAMLRIGQFKTMYGLERSQGAMDLNFMERAMTESLLGSVFDRGVMLHGAPFNGLYYNLAYVNGTGQNIDETDAKTDSKDWSLRIVGNLAQWMGWKDSVVHVGGFYVDGKQAAGSALPQVRTEGRGVSFFTTTSKTFANGVDRTIGGFESAVAYGPLKYQGEYIKAGFDDGSFDRDMMAGYASLQWLVTGEKYADFYKNGVFLGIVPKNNFRYGTGGWGALELGARYTSFNAEDFRSLLANTATTVYADAWTLGAKWILNPNAQVQLNYVHTSFDSPITLNGKTDDHEDAMNMRVQFDF